MPPFLVIAAEAHRNGEAKCNFYPWTDDERRYVGWRLRYDDGREEYCYLIPNLDGPGNCAIFHGPHGDPQHDMQIGTT
jgi:hypothetical protein